MVQTMGWASVPQRAWKGPRPPGRAPREEGPRDSRAGLDGAGAAARAEAVLRPHADGAARGYSGRARRPSQCVRRGQSGLGRGQKSGLRPLGGPAEGRPDPAFPTVCFPRPRRHLLGPWRRRPAPFGRIPAAPPTRRGSSGGARRPEAGTGGRDRGRDGPTGTCGADGSRGRVRRGSGAEAPRARARRPAGLLEKARLSPALL